MISYENPIRVNPYQVSQRWLKLGQLVITPLQNGINQQSYPTHSFLCTSYEPALCKKAACSRRAAPIIVSFTEYFFYLKDISGFCEQGGKKLSKTYSNLSDGQNQHAENPNVNAN